MTRKAICQLGSRGVCTRDNNEANSFRAYALAMRRATLLDVGGDLAGSVRFALSRPRLYRNPFIISLSYEFLAEFAS